jgi:hypothetical protein
MSTGMCYHGARILRPGAFCVLCASVRDCVVLLMMAQKRRNGPIPLVSRCGSQLNEPCPVVCEEPQGMVLPLCATRKGAYFMVAHAWEQGNLRLLPWQRDGEERLAFFHDMAAEYQFAMSLSSVAAYRHRDQIDRLVNTTLGKYGWEHPAAGFLRSEAQLAGLDLHQLVRTRLTLACFCPPVFGWQITPIGSVLYLPPVNVAIDTDARTRNYWWNGIALRPMRSHQLQVVLANTQPVAEQAIRAAGDALMAFRELLSPGAREYTLATLLWDMLADPRCSVDERLSVVRAFARRSYPDVASRQLARSVDQWLRYVFPSPLYTQGGLYDTSSAP